MVTVKHFRVSDVQVTLSLCKYIIPETDRLNAGAYSRIAADLIMLGGSPRYVGDIWRQRKKEIMNSLNTDLMKSLKHRKGAGAPRRISVEDLQARVKALPFNFCKNYRTLANKVGVPYSTIQRALKLGFLKTSRNCIKPLLT